MKAGARQAADRQGAGARGVMVVAAGTARLAEEQPEAYKDVDEVVEVVDKAGLSQKVARLRPIGVIKG